MLRGLELLERNSGREHGLRRTLTCAPPCRAKAVAFDEKCSQVTKVSGLIRPTEPFPLRDASNEVCSL
jgi:hypothetical protein